ncbi:MFS general substrate transporter, partial [Ramicandelaber brevisporus]
MSTAYEKVTSPACGADPAMLLTADEQARLRRKINWRILPIVFVVYLVSFLDRSAAGNGRLYSLEADLAMSQSQFSWALSAFFILYILAELPSNMGLKRTSPSRWLAFLVCGWGATVVVSAWATNFAFFLAMRVLLGGFE